MTYGIEVVPTCKLECEKHDELGDACEAEHPQSHFLCSRAIGHAGPHVACGLSSHAKAVWPNKPTGECCNGD